MTSKACPLRYEELLQPLATGTPAARTATEETVATATTGATAAPALRYNDPRAIY